MVASSDLVILLQLSSDWINVAEVLHDPDARGPFGPPDGDSFFRVNIRQPVASKEVARLCLVAQDNLLVALGLIRAERRSGDLDTLIRVDFVHRLHHNVDLLQAVGDLSPRLAHHGRAALTQTAVLGERTANELLQVLTARSPEVADALVSLEDRLRGDRPVRDLSQATVELHDAVTLGLRLAGFPSGVLHDQKPTAGTTPANYFARLETPGRAPSEAAMIRHDATHFGSWIPTDGDVLDVVEFTDPLDPQRRVTVLYADKEAEERVTGADLIYFREHFPGFVLVQYKRMRREGSDPDSPYGYRPDKQLFEELRRMRAALATVPKATFKPGLAVASWRLHDQPFYMKLVQEGRNRPERGDLIVGMYVPIDLFELLLSDATVRGPKLTLPIGWDNAGRWLTNTDFLGLMQDGWIGSTGLTTSHLAAIVQEVWATGRSALIVHDHTPATQRRRAVRT